MVGSEGRARVSRRLEQAGNSLRQRQGRVSRRYSNLLDLPGVSLNTTSRQLELRNVPEKVENVWQASQPAHSQNFNAQERRFFKDFRPFFFLCQLTGMFPYKLQWNLPFSWCYWGTILCLLNLFMMLLLFVFYSYQAIESIKNKEALLYIIYNFSWVIHVVHAIDWIVNFFHDRKLFVQIFQGYRKFYRYLLADMSDKSVIKFTWKTFVSWEIMFYIAAAVLVFKSYYDRFGFSASETPEEIAKRRVIQETCTQFGFVQSGSTGNRTLLATVDQLSWMQDTFSKTFLDFVFWINLAANIICLNITFLSEVFFMVMISIIFHAFIFIHKQIDGLLGNPDSIFNINVVHEPLDNVEAEADHIVRKELKEVQGFGRRRSLESSWMADQAEGISLRALWEQMEELIDLLEQVNDAFGMTLQFLALEYLLLFPALLYFCIDLYSDLSAISLGGSLISVIILGIRSFVFTFVCARVHKETIAPVNTLYRAYVKGDVAWHDYDLVHMFINRLSTHTFAVRTWTHVPITRQTFSVVFVIVFSILAVLL